MPRLGRLLLALSEITCLLEAKPKGAPAERASPMLALIEESVQRLRRLLLALSENHWDPLL